MLETPCAHKFDHTNMSWLQILCLQFFLLISRALISCSYHFLCHLDESSSLLQFKASFDIDITDTSCGKLAHADVSTWQNGTDCCSWLGVTCDTISGHIIGLDLSCNGLQGMIHPNSSLFHISHLQTLNLAHNRLFPSQFSSQFGSFVNLTHLNFSDTGMQGEVSSDISHLSNLVSLDLSMNDDLKWTQEITLKRLLQNATSVTDLVLDYTNMSFITPSLFFSFLNFSSLATISLKGTGLKGNMTTNDNTLCLPKLQKLDVSANFHLQGQLPKLSCSTSLNVLDLSLCQFQGSILQFFSNLTHLTFLSLSENNIGGEISPSSLSSLKQLTLLDFSGNKLTGRIPDVFGELTKLKTLILKNNYLQGQIPFSLFHLTSLSHLDCSSNKLEGYLPDKVTGLSNLTALWLNNNTLKGTFPSWSLSLPSLVELDLSNNQFTGYLSTEISSHSLEYMFLCNNMLQGNIPESLFNLVNLTNLCLSSNNLSGLVNFKLISKFQNLESLSLSRNSQLSLNFESDSEPANYSFPSLRVLELSSLSLTELPKSFGELFPSLVYVDLSNNKLSGRVPNWLPEMSLLQSLNLSQNMFTSIDQFSMHYWLRTLDLSFNSLGGEISLSICNATVLQILNLSHNKFTGIIPQCIANLPFLQVLDVEMNKLYGSVPNTFSSMTFSTLNLNGNQLQGPLPKSLSNCTNLEVLNLGNNKIEDMFPYWLQTLPNLKVLVLRANKLHGPITKLKINNNPFPSLIIFDISYNDFSGPIPKSYIENFEAMKNVVPLQLQYMKKMATIATTTHTYEFFYDSVTVTTKGINIIYTKIPTIFVSIDLSGNKFEGKIPNAIRDLRALIGLNLSHNRLIGPIPGSLGNLINVESVDLSSNMLTGKIPIELTNLNYLAVLNVSKNRLEGAIPRGGQFDTFSNDSYKGNLGLCGLPLSINCKNISKPSDEHEQKFGFGWQPVAIGYGCGMVFGVGLGCLVLLIGKPQWLVIMVGGKINRRKTRMRVQERMNQNQLLQM